MQISQFALTGVEVEQISLICGPMKMPYFSLPSLSFGNFSLEYSKPLPRLFVVLTNFFFNPNVMCSGNNKILSLSPSGRFLTQFCPETEFSRMGQSLIL